MSRRIQITFALSIALVAFGNCEDCSLPPDSGSCSKIPEFKYETRFYYSADNFKCTPFPYSGCGGNANNFKTEADCAAKCVRKFAETTIAKDILLAQKQSKCWFKNETYARGVAMPKVTDGSPCSQGCFCDEGYDMSSNLQIVCAQTDCPPYPTEPAGCVPIYKDSACCAEYVCPNDKKQSDVKCSYAGETYVEGQTFEQDEFPCLSCTCTKSFNGTLTTANGICKEVNCGIMIRNQHHLLNNCKPEFYKTQSGKDSCCPIQWDCGQMK